MSLTWLSWASRLTGRRLSRAIRNGNTELEFCVLSVIRRQQPCTAYQVRPTFAASLTCNWRASAGAIYPLIRNLEERRSIALADRAGDGRGSRLLSITPLGLEQLAGWVREVTAAIAAPTADPIRTRLYALEILPEPEQVAQICAWTCATEECLRDLRLVLAEFREAGDPAEIRAYRATELQLDARLRWLSELAKELSDTVPSPALR